MLCDEASSLPCPQILWHKYGRSPYYRSDYAAIDQYSSIIARCVDSICMYTDVYITAKLQTNPKPCLKELFSEK